MRVLLVQLASMGDCLLVTTIARQIKEVDYPGCHLTWMIGKQYKDLLLNNPYVDETIVVDASRDDRNKIPFFVESANQSFDKIFITDFFIENYRHFFGTTRSAFFRTYGKKIVVPVEPLIFLTDREVTRVASFVKKHGINDADCYPILVEFAPQSKQSNMDFAMARRVATNMIREHPKTKFIFSSKEPLPDKSDTIIDASVLSWRENAELTKYCKLLLGASSAITWLNTSNWAAKIPMIQFLRSEYMWGVLSPSVELDFMYWGLSTDGLIEITDGNEDELVDCLCRIVGQSFDDARKYYPCRSHLSRTEIDNYFAGRLAQSFFSLTMQNPGSELPVAPLVSKTSSPVSFVLSKTKSIIKSNRYTHKFFRKLKRLIVN
jgi:hypothetical protein